MTPPTITELPPPASAKPGWPWTESPSLLPATMPNGTPWPRVTIVTPSYNQADFIEETIRSVLLQGYPNLEYIIIDGGSTDGSADIIRKYEPWLAYWVSERDHGQSEAINKGFRRATGEIVAWLNSDDTFAPDTLAQAASAFARSNDPVLVYGNCNIIDEQSEVVRQWRAKHCTLESLLLDGNQIPQQSAFIRREALNQVGPINEGLHYVMDFELWLRLGVVGPLAYSPELTANFRWHNVSKSISQSPRFWHEQLKVLDEWAALRERIPATALAEIYRRTYLHGALEYLYVGKPTDALDFMEHSLTDGVWPYGSAAEMAQAMIENAGLSGLSLRDDPQVLSECLSVVSRLSNPYQARRLQDALHSYEAMRHVFLAFDRGDMATVRQHVLTGIRYSPSWLRNRGVLSILFQAYRPPLLGQ
ncbi:MAG: glycosyltransferase family 2 protein [Anaerolineae bacterium]